mgnify:CR=1 FL=1
MSGQPEPDGGVWQDRYDNLWEKSKPGGRGIGATGSKYVEWATSAGTPAPPGR